MQAPPVLAHLPPERFTVGHGQLRCRGRRGCGMIGGEVGEGAVALVSDGHAGRSWFAWNNACGDRATLSYSGTVIDSAYYETNPPGVLVRQPRTDRLVPAPAVARRW